eukprot:CAMPEP_0201546956 /NCGR_PEP_ID=MMETSP0173_2-20130828/3337_1 /ASSEMBLY_ACC=CAM_ASM_000268 /TAXON_ID=218659 /ORGANISM="Vexillifera sp., Strain DIVA3 564/2" /LENGTH=945 /DNA_ID=CAMNT_0047955811 /DNA_START=20 /DNA_END=2854 /DNA_ORIENTATION=-
MKLCYLQLVALIVLGVLIASQSCNGHMHLESDNYPQFNAQGMSVSSNSDGAPLGKLFYCDVGSSGEEGNETCEKLRSDVHPFLPVTVVSTGNGTPLIFYGENRDQPATSGLAHQMSYFRCLDPDCTTLSEPRVLEGFNGKHALSWTHIEIGGERILVVAGTGRLISSVHPQQPSYALRYAWCVDAICSEWESYEISSPVDDATEPAVYGVQETGLTPKVVQIAVFGDAHNPKLAFYYHRRDFEISASYVQETQDHTLPDFTTSPFGYEGPWNLANNYADNYYQHPYMAIVRCEDPPLCNDLNSDYVYVGGSNAFAFTPKGLPWDKYVMPSGKKRDEVSDTQSQQNLAGKNQAQNNYNWNQANLEARWGIGTASSPSMVVGTSQGLWVGVVNYQNQRVSQSGTFDPEAQADTLKYDVTYPDEVSSIEDPIYEQSDISEFSLAIGGQPKQEGAFFSFIPCGKEGTGCRKASRMVAYQYAKESLSNPLSWTDNDPLDWLPQGYDTSDHNTLVDNVEFPVPDPHLGWSFANSRHNLHDTHYKVSQTVDNDVSLTPSDNFNTAFSPFAAGAAGNGFPAAIGVVTAKSGEPSAAGWSVVLSVCLTEQCDQQVFRYLMDSAAVNDNWGVLDDPFSGANEIINHPDGSWTIVLYVSPNSEQVSRNWARELYDADRSDWVDAGGIDDGPDSPSVCDLDEDESPTQIDSGIDTCRPSAPVEDRKWETSGAQQGSTGKPLFIHCLDETCSEASISTASPTRTQTMVPAEVAGYYGTQSFQGWNVFHDEKMVGLHANRPQTYAFVGEKNERLIMTIRDVTAGTTQSTVPVESSVPAIRMYITNRYNSPTGMPCTRHNVGETATAGDVAYTCTRLKIGSHAHRGGISGWVRYYEWVDASAAFGARLFANIPAGPSPNTLDPIVMDLGEPPYADGVDMSYPFNIGALTDELNGISPNDW